MRGLVPRAAALAVAATVAGCWVPIERGRQMEARIQRLEVQGEEQRTVFHDRIAKVDLKIKEVQNKIDELNQAARRSGADLGVQLSKLSDELARVKGELEVSQHQLRSLERSVGALDQKTEGRFAALRGAGALEEYEAKQKLSALPRGDEKAALLALAREEDKAGDKGVARQLYEEYARRWPTDPTAVEARFRAGELLFDQRRWREALLAYGKVAEDFPRSELAPEAMLGAAEAMVKLDMQDEARAVFGQVIAKYPKHKAAARARERVAEIWPAPAPKETPKPARKR